MDEDIMSKSKVMCFGVEESKNQNKEPVIINGDQMPLHRNESAGQKTVSKTPLYFCQRKLYVEQGKMHSVYSSVHT